MQVYEVHRINDGSAFRAVREIEAESPHQAATIYASSVNDCQVELSTVTVGDRLSIFRDEPMQQQYIVIVSR